MTSTAPSKNNGTIVTAESVADILERELDHLIHDWMALVEKQEDLMAVSFDAAHPSLPKGLPWRGGEGEQAPCDLSCPLPAGAGRF